MPVYEFECPQGNITERLVRMDTKSIKCPHCGRRAKKIMSRCSFELKGGGWYADGYSASKKPAQNKPKENKKTEDGSKKAP